MAQYLRGRRPSARADRQSQFRQSGAARDHGAIRRLRSRHRRSGACARFPDRVRQRLALQRDQRPRHSADPDHRRRRPARQLHRLDDDRVQSGGRVDPPGRRHARLARPVALSARDLRPRGGRSAAGRSCRRTAPRRIRARPDPRWPRDRGARYLRRRPSRRARRNGDGLAHRCGARSAACGLRRTLFGSARIKPATC